MKAWKVELNELLEKIERHTSASLWRIRKEFEKSNLIFDRKFRKRFLRLTNNRLSEVYDRIEIESLADSTRSNHGQFRYRYENERNGRLRSTRESSAELEPFFRSTEERSQHPKKIKPSSTKRLATVHKRLGKKINHNATDLLKSIFSSGAIKNEQDANPFRLTRDPGDETPFTAVKVKQEVPSPSPSINDEDCVKRKHTDDGDSECKRRKSSQDEDLDRADNDMHLDDVTFFCAHCEDAKISNESSKGTIEDVYGHWLSGHTTDLTNIKSFWFYVSGTMACFHCDTVSTYREINQHNSDCHPNEIFAVTIPRNRISCALCKYVGDEMVEHFTDEHQDLLQSQVFNPARLSEDLLGQLFAIDIHKKRQCGKCDIILETQHEMDAHHSIEHSGELVFNEFFNRKSAYIICDHCSCKVDGTKFFSHIENHRQSFTCSKCDFKTDDVIELIVHDKDDHRINSLNFHCLNLSEQLKKQFFNSKVVFGNGLILTNHNFKNTIYDDSKPFDDFLESVVETVKRKFIRLIGKKTTEAERDLTSRATSVSSYDAFDSHRNPFRVSSMPSLISELDQQNQLDNNLSILGIPRFRNENLMEIFMKLCKKLKAKVSTADVINIYRHNGVNEPVIVKFRNYESKILVKNSAHVRDVWSGDIFKLPPDEKSTKIFVNLHTTRFYGKMVSIAREARKAKSLYSYYLCKRGLVVKRTELSKERIVLSANELMDYIYGSKGKQSTKEYTQQFKRSSK